MTAARAIWEEAAEARSMNTSGLAPKPLRRASEYLEEREHRALAAELRLRIGEPGRVGRNRIFWTSIDHSNSSPQEGARKKAKGVAAGIPDLMLVRGGRNWSRTFWVELKRKKGGALSRPQREFRGHVEALGHCWAVCHGAEAAIEQLRAWKLIA